MNRNIFPSIQVEYAGSPSITVSVDGTNLLANSQLPTHSSFRGRRVTLPALGVGYITHLESDSTQLQNYVFEAAAIESYSTQALYHYYEVGYRGANLQLQIYLDSTAQAQTVTLGSANVAIDTVRVYFDQLAFGFIPHIHNIANSTYDGEVLWARPVALPPRFFRGIRTHAEFQITYVGDVTLQWYLDGEEQGDPYVLPTVSSTTTEKLYFPAGTIGHILQYRVTNPTAGRVYVVETDVTLADLEQQTMTQNTEERV
jgi:hypothetical protein